MASGSDPSESANFYMELIQSRELLTRLLLSRFHDPRSASPGDSATLLDILRIRNSDPKRRLEIAIKRMSTDIDGNYDIKTNLVWIEVDAQWPELSAAMANRTIDLVTGFQQRTAGVPRPVEARLRPEPPRQRQGGSCTRRKTDKNSSTTRTASGARRRS